MSSKTNEKQSNILKFKKKRSLNIGIIFFGIIFIYLVATIVMYLTAPHITVYEVRQGSILKDTAYTGLAIRDEIVVTATDSGYINYYAQDKSKVKVGSNIYTLSEDKLTFEEAETSENVMLSSEEEKSIALEVQQFVYDYRENRYAETYDLKSEIEAALGGFTNSSKLSQLNDMISQGVLSDVKLYRTADDGVVVYSVDGLENLTVDTATVKHLDKSNYHKTEFTNNSKIKSGDAVYKIITDDEWSLLVELDDETASILEEKSSVKVNFTKDSQTMWANLQVKTVDNHHMAYLTFKNSMIRYAGERYLDIELILEDETGLKIPKSAETQKNFYVVPMDYITLGGDSNENGVLKLTKDIDGKDIVAFTSVTIYYRDEQEQLVYLDPNQLDKDDVLQKPDSDESYALNEQRSLKGVYCINKGYAVFKQIHILCESDTYYIISEGSDYGLSNYDHIALYSTNIKENDVVF